MSDSLFELQYFPGEELVLRIKSPGMKKMMPDDVKEHFWTARKEMLLAIRGLVDAAAAKAEEYAKPKKTKASKKTKVDIK